MEPSQCGDDLPARIDTDFEDLNNFVGLGEDPAYHPPILTDRPRLWPLDKWAEAPRGKGVGYDEFPNSHWKGLRLLKHPDTQVAYHNILWELRPTTIIELGVYGGGSLVWFRDLTKVFGFATTIFGIDIDMSKVQIPSNEMENISLLEADCKNPESISTILSPFDQLQHPILYIDDAHCNTFQVLKTAVNTFLSPGDYVIIEDSMMFWKRYCPKMLKSYLAAFQDVLAMDLLYSNVPCQIKDSVFKVISKDDKEQLKLVRNAKNDVGNNKHAVAEETQAMTSTGLYFG